MNESITENSALDFEIFNRNEILYKVGNKMRKAVHSSGTLHFHVERFCQLIKQKHSFIYPVVMDSLDFFFSFRILYKCICSPTSKC